jgi:replicative DNA helicase
MTPALSPPVELEVERAVLGAALLEPEAAALVATLPRELFHPEAHRVAAAAIATLVAAGSPVDPVTVRTALEAAGGWRPDSGGSQLAGWLEAATVSSALPSHLATLRDRATRRGLLRAGGAVLAGAVDLGTPVGDTLGRHLAACVALEAGHSPDAILTPAEFAAELRDGADPMRLETGLQLYDDLAGGGLTVGDLHLLAGRPGFGKTALGVQVAAYVATRSGLPILFVSMDMTRRQIGHRYLRHHGLDALARSGFHVTDPTGPTTDQLAALIRRTVALHACQLVVVDHVDNVEPTVRRERRDLEVREVAKTLRNLARALEVPILALCQMSRAIEKRNSPRPVLSDLRDSGSLEQEAATVTFVWTKDESPDGKATLPVSLFLAKNRHGATGERAYRFEKADGRMVAAA